MNAISRSRFRNNAATGLCSRDQKSNHVLDRFCHNATGLLKLDVVQYLVPLNAFVYGCRLQALIQQCGPKIELKSFNL